MRYFMVTVNSTLLSAGCLTWLALYLCEGSDMSFLALVGLFLLKHGLLVHVVDYGYSRSRSKRQRLWYLGLLCHCLLELAASVVIIWAFWIPEITVGLLLELAMLCVACVLERQATYSKLIRTHVFGELLVLLSYCTMGLMVHNT